ncbi:hypothetical protein PPROV_000840100 [Pycnococcus provasolii]|uniref:Malonyl-CoA:ACP transacylase (MAT) domain-containing protein n=1 Tax=Pycnococcus provasolii TaxID=41880 RepID=A0A830HQ74_9CHLO|nr:hypothetical protein PPROV_000840100 [Pycnococcus provasolii]
MMSARTLSRINARTCNAHSATSRRLTSTRASADDAFANYAPKTAFLFPGQGAQSVGMAGALCEEVPAAKALFDKASDILGYDLLAVCTEGPAEKLNTTEVSQPAIYVASLAALEKLKETDPAAYDACNVTAGLSLGEYTALTFAGAIDFEDGVKLVKLRGESMQKAADAVSSGMASIIGLSSDKVQTICDDVCKELGDDKAVQIANYLCNGNYAVSGSIPGIEKVQEVAKPNYKARMAVRLAVAGAFHTDYMSPATEALTAALAETPVSAPRIPVLSNVDAEPHSDPETIKAILAKQVTSPVKWENTMQTLLDRGLESAYEIGPGKVCAGIMKRVSKEFPAVTNVEA